MAVNPEAVSVLPAQEAVLLPQAVPVLEARLRVHLVLELAPQEPGPELVDGVARVLAGADGTLLNPPGGKLGTPN